MNPYRLAFVVLLPLAGAGCSHPTLTGQAAIEAMSYEDVPTEPELREAVPTGARGVDPQRALRSARSDSARWKREKPVNYAAMPVHPGESALRKHALPQAFTEVRPSAVVTTAGAPQATAFAALKGKPYDGEAVMTRLEAGSRKGVGTICTGC